MSENINHSEENGEGRKKRRVRISTSSVQPEKVPYRSTDATRSSGYSNSESPQGGGYSSPYRSRESAGSSYNRDNSRGDYRSQDNRNRGYNDRGGDNYRSSYDNRRPSYQSNDQRSGGNRSYGQRDNNYGNNQGGYRQNNQYNQDRGGYNNNRGGGYGQRDNSYNSNRGGDGYRERTPYRDNREYNSGYSNDRGYERPRFNAPKQPNAPKRLVKPIKYKETHDPSTEIRLNKYLANAGVCSRREADSHIVAGAVKVNGEIITELGAKVTYADEIRFHDNVVTPESKVYVLLNKPKNTVTTSDDPQNRITVMDLVKNACAERIYPVGRLDRNTTGVLLLTNDGDLASKLMHPKFKKKKIYQVTLDRDVAVEDMQAIADGITLDDGDIHADSIAYVSEDKLNEVGIEIHSGRNRIVRRIFEKLNYHVVKLDRVYFSGLTKKNVPRGKWRYLLPEEVNMLRMGAFE